MGYMEQSYIFDFCTLYNMEQAKDIEHYQSKGTITTKYVKSH